MTDRTPHAASAPSPAPSSPVHPTLAAPPRPARALSSLAMLKTAGTDMLGICDEELFDELVVVRRYGLLSLAFVSDPAGIKHVLVDRFDDYPRVPAVKRLYAAEMGTGTLATSGEIWWRHRRVSAPTLDRRAIAPDVPNLIASARTIAASWAQAGAEGPIDIEARVGAMWSELLNLVATGGDPRGVPILAWLAKVPRKPKPLDLIPMPEWLRARVNPARQSPERAALREQLLVMMNERLEPGYAGRHDLLWRIAHSVDRQTGEPLPLSERRDEASSLIGAGEASIRALTWIWYLLALHPEVEARVHAEIDRVLDGRELQPDRLKEFTYTRRVLDEVIRLYPPIPLIVRQASRRDVVCGRKIPKGTVIMVAPWVVHRHRRLWSEPERFDPDRFSPERSADRPRLAYIPFSVGPGVCSGSNLALTQMMIVIVSLARRYRFRLASDEPVVPFSGISLQPRGGLWVKVEAR